MRVHATEASRNFSDLLTRVAGGETVEIDRLGQVVAVVSPPRQRSLDAASLTNLLNRVPHPDAGFGDDVERLSSILRPPREAWGS